MKDDTDDCRVCQCEPSAVVFHRGFYLWTWEESSTGCLSAVPWCLEKAHGLFNSQPIFCPSHHFIPTLELSSGPHTVTFWHISQPTPRQYQKILSANPPPTHPCPQLAFNMSNKSYFQTGCMNRTSYCLQSTPICIWLSRVCFYMCVTAMKSHIEWDIWVKFLTDHSELIGWPKQFSRIVPHEVSHVDNDRGSSKRAQHAQPSKVKKQLLECCHSQEISMNKGLATSCESSSGSSTCFTYLRLNFAPAEQAA